jgi:hypothetical protein
VADQLPFRLHHALHVLKSFEARAGRDAAVRGAALLVKPLVALANELGAISVFPFSFKLD